MSFMFHPHPFSDPNAVNPVAAPAEVKAALVAGLLPFCKFMKVQVAAGKKLIGLDGYAGAQFMELRHALEQYLPPETLFINAEEMLLKSDVLEVKIAPCLPMDREIDPVLMYGARFTEGYAGLQDAQKTEAIRVRLSHAQVPVVVYGQGALCDALRPVYDIKLWMDITPKQAALNFKHGRAKNLGAPAALPYGLMMRRNYYIDFEAAVELRWHLMKTGELDYYITADAPTDLRMLPFDQLKELFDELIKRPLRCRPVYLEGVWGGFHMKKLRNLPAEMKNCAWIFDMIPMEVSLAATFDGQEFEVPFFTFVQMQGKKLLGGKVFEQFGGYFPMRFNYDDTYHSSGNMSIQCHPGEEYCKTMHNELGRQDESYYVCVTGQQARTYLGFQNENSCADFLKAARTAEKTGELIDYEQYVYSVPSVPGTQVMIPAGTIHASGRNQVILEIGSLTMGSYTYKLYDYQRIDPQSGLPRPIHLNAGELALCPERTKEWVDQNIVNHGYTARQGDTWREQVIGEHDLLYFSLRNLIFETEMTDDTKDAMHVLTLVDGEQVRVESIAAPSQYFVARSLDILVVPASFGPYRLVNEGLGVVTVHKTIVKE